MAFFQLVFDHLWEIFWFCVVFGGSIGAAMRWIVRKLITHRETMQELRNDQLHLQLRIEQERKSTNIHTSRFPHSVTKDAESYQSGYQEQAYGYNTEQE